MADPFKRQMQGYRGGGTKREQNRHARAKLKVETRTEAEDAQVYHCLDWYSEPDPCPECGAPDCEDFPGCYDPPWAAMTDEELMAETADEYEARFMATLRISQDEADELEAKAIALLGR